MASMDDSREKVQTAVELLSSVASSRSRCEACSSGQEPPQAAAVEFGNQRSQDRDANTVYRNQPSVGGLCD